MNSAQPHSATWCSSPRLISVITHTRDASSRGKAFSLHRKTIHYTQFGFARFTSLRRGCQRRRGNQGACLYIWCRGSTKSKNMRPGFQKSALRSVCCSPWLLRVPRIECIIVSNKQDFGSLKLQLQSIGDGGTASQKRATEHFWTCIQNGKVEDKSRWNRLFSLGFLLISSSSFN